MILLGTGYATDTLFIILCLVILLLLFFMLSYKFIRGFLFLLRPESAHNISFIFIKFLMFTSIDRWIWSKIYSFKHPKLNREVFGLKFQNPVGLAAGFDKDAKLFHQLETFGFGFIEIGTVTPLRQDGSPKPRLFRLKSDEALINRMGFNNEGIESVVARLRRKKSNIIIGGNIGKNKKTNNEQAVNDYEICFEKLFPYVDYFVVNVSSPNTPGLRDLQEKEPLTNLLISLQKINNNKDRRKPILVKISPDLNNSQLDDIIEIIKITMIDGVIATNTTISRREIKTNKNKIKEIGDGGLSGKPLCSRSTQVIEYLSKKSNKMFPIIGVGGIHSAKDALEKLDAGADLIQLYTGFIYEGPALVKRINKAILGR